MARDIELDTTILKETRGSLSQEAVAENVGISRRAYNQLEKRGTCLKTTAEKIAKFLGVTVKHLQGLERAELFSPFFCEVQHPGIDEGKPQCCGQLFPDSDLSFSSFATGDKPSLAAWGLRWL